MKITVEILMKVETLSGASLMILFKDGNIAGQFMRNLNQ